MMQDKDHFIMSKDLEDNIDLSSYFEIHATQSSCIINIADIEYKTKILRIENNIKKKYLYFYLKLDNNLSFIDKVFDISNIGIYLIDKKLNFKKEDIIKICYEDNLLKIKLKHVSS